MTEYYHTLLEKGGRLLKDGEVVQETDYQILGHKENEAQTPPGNRASLTLFLSVCLER